MPGEFFDASSDPRPTDATPDGGSRRRYVGVVFDCCRVYARVYVNRDETAYVGYCPKCSKRVQLRIGPDGTDARFFTAY